MNDEDISPNGTEKHPNFLSEVTGQISDHLDLAALELGYESQQLAIRLAVAGAIFILLLTGFIVLQVAVIGALMRVGLSLGLASLLVSLVYFGLAGSIFWKWGRRDKRVGAPMAATLREVHETLRWIQKVFS